MNSDLYRRAKAVFFEVCDAPPGDHARLLADRCHGDPNLRAAVEALLADDPGEAGDGPFAPRPEAALLSAALAAPDPTLTATAPDPAEIAGCRVLSRLGEGGMGSVFACEQQSPRRTVAIKLIRRGAASPATLRRFRLEAEALGRLRHPAIAGIFEAGAGAVTYPDGSAERAAYIMMERVHGEPLTAYADRHQLAIPARLRLLIAVCEGVRHAHAMSVVHRDLKPANILVEGPPAAPVPRILDFGIARISSPDRHATLATSPGQILGTLAYMSPEQVAGDPSLVDTRSDVYALGVILFELLAGRVPHEFSGVSLAQAARIASEADAPDLASAVPGLPADLATIAAKALRKAPEERYQSAADLAADLARFLADEPISARPATRLYILRKFARRHRALVALGATAALALAAGAALAAAGLLSARAANAQLRTTIAQRERQLQRSEQVLRLMRSMLLSVKPFIARDRDTTLMREVLERAQKQLDAGELRGQPLVEAEMRAVLAETYAALGDNTAALAQAELAMGPPRADPDDPDPVFQRIRRTYADILFDWGRTDDADRELDALERTRRLARQSGEIADAEILSARAAIAARRGRSDESVRLQLRALDIRRGVLGDRHPSIASTSANLAGALQNLGRYDEALPLLEECLAICESMDPPALMHITIVRNNLADLLLHMGRFADAERSARAGLDIARTIYQPGHQQLGLLHYTLANALRAQQRHDEALAHYLDAARALAQAFGERNPLAVGARIDAAAELAALARPDEARRELAAARGAADPATPEGADALRRCDEALSALR